MTNSRSTKSRFTILIATAIALLLVAAACGDDAGDGGGESAPVDGNTATTRTPKSGGVLTFGEFSEPAGLDPIVSTGHGTTGAIEMGAIYDTIVRYDPDKGTYANRTAESVTSNPDFTVWTVKIKPNIKFTDGTDYDAEAVAFGLNRHRSGQTGAPACAELFACPRNSTSSSAAVALIQNIKVVDKLTIEVSLSEPWAAFPYALSAEPGMIPSPTALKKCDPTKTARDCEFNLKPVGAGPFMIESFKAKEAITMVRNPNYWDGQVYLDGLRFVTFSDAGGLKTLDALKTGTLGAGFLRAPDAVALAHEAKMSGYSIMEHGGGVLLFNTGLPVTCTGGNPQPVCAGKPDGPTPSNVATADVRVRRAVAAALDPKVLDARANGGKGLPSTDFIQSDFKWFPGVTGPKYDPDTAKKLVAEAKAAGWDGKLRLLFNSSATASNLGLATQTLLQAVGIDASLDVSKDTTAQVLQFSVQRDFELTTYGIALASDDGAPVTLAQNFGSTSASNRSGFKSTAVDAALKELRAASTDSAKTAAYKKIMEEVSTNLPVYAWSKVEEFIAWSPKVHGLIPTNRATVRFDKAWIES